MLVSGEAGVGKSTLVDAFADELDLEARVLWAVWDLKVDGFPGRPGILKAEGQFIALPP